MCTHLDIQTANQYNRTPLMNIYIMHKYTQDASLKFKKKGSKINFLQTFSFLSFFFGRNLQRIQGKFRGRFHQECPAEPRPQNSFNYRRFFIINNTRSHNFIAFESTRFLDCVSSSPKPLQLISS